MRGFSMWRLVLPTIVLFAAGCATAPDSPEGRSSIERDASSSVTQAEQSDPTLKKVLDDTVGYAVFTSVGKGAIGVGGAYGKGVLFQGGAAVGYCDLSQASIGLQLGGQAYTEIIAFSQKDALDHFKSGNYSFDAQATAVALKSGAGANAKYAGGVAVFTMAETGLMYEASIGGQKFSYVSK